jgi:Domain of unknown function (DUF4440)
MLTPLAAALLLALPPADAPSGAPPEPVEVADVVVAAALEDLRKGELLLDADGLEPLIARSFTLVERSSRLSGSFAYLEPMRRMRGRDGEVSELRFEEVVIRVYGASAVASYRYRKVVKDAGARTREEGWSSDVFELRDDGAWILVHRHRSK